MTSGTMGADLIAAIVAEMAVEGVQSTAMEDALLRTAGQLVDRLAALEAAVERDGEILVSKTGVTRVHPAVTEHRQIAATLPKVLAGVVVGNSASGPVKNAAKQRATSVGPTATASGVRRSVAPRGCDGEAVADNGGRGARARHS